MLKLERDDTGTYITNGQHSIYITEEDIETLKKVKDTAYLSRFISQKVCDNKKERQTWSIVRKESPSWSEDLKNLRHQIKGR